MPEALGSQAHSPGCCQSESEDGEGRTRFYCADPGITDLSHEAEVQEVHFTYDFK